MNSNDTMTSNTLVNDTDEEDDLPISKRARLSTSSNGPVSSRTPNTQRQSAVRCSETPKTIAADTLGVMSPARKDITSQKYVPGVNAALKSSKVERNSLVKQSPDAVKKLAESKNPTKQDSLLGTPEVMLAQANAHSITFHRLVQENEDQKKNITELSHKVETLEKARATAEREQKNLHDEKAGMKSKIEHLEASARSRERHVSQIAKLKRDLKDAQNQLENKSAENSRLQATLKSINEMSRKL